ncbi:hypothetical protein [Parasutterella excrementihominis]|uniref:hypothetical protein n=1 Tax=Parasutterella excrementihominis TaxID=487175 RepID=UPI0012BCB1EF|nr:hypothetical protein [Parasutterella excrementihominis]MTU25115.1 hypothetical protein [Parasutterella excrementihominis]
MAKAAIKLDLSKIAVNTVDSDRRVITSESVQRPVRDILATVNAGARQAAWNALVADVIGMRGETVEAKGASWAVNDDEIARSLRVNFNIMQAQGTKMDKTGSRKFLTDILEQLDMPEPVFKDDSDETDNS